MQGSKSVVAALNGVLRHQLTAINQYFLHARMLRNWGVAGLGKRDYKESIEAMKEADAVIARVLLLDGLPNLQDLGKLLVGETVAEMVANDLELERQSRTLLLAAVALCEQESDFVSRDLLQEFLEECEERIDFGESELHLLAEMGEENYIQRASGDVS